LLARDAKGEEAFACQALAHVPSSARERDEPLASNAEVVDCVRIEKPAAARSEVEN